MTIGISLFVSLRSTSAPIRVEVAVKMYLYELINSRTYEQSKSCNMYLLALSAKEEQKNRRNPMIYKKV